MSEQTEDVSEPTAEEKQAADDSLRERDVQEELQRMGITLVNEDPHAAIGGKPVYNIKALHRDDNTEFEANGDCRLNALLAVLMTAKSKGYTAPPADEAVEMTRDVEEAADEEA